MATSATSATTGSNIDVASIVSQLMTVERRPLNALNTKEFSYQAKLSAYGNLQGALSSFQTAVSGLNDPSKFQSLRATSSDSSIATASAASTAPEGAYALEVTSLAQSQKLAATGNISQTAVIGNGVLTFDFGTIDASGGSFNPTTGKYTDATYTSSGSGLKTVTIDATNNSLQGIRDAINKAKIGVTATIVNDGSASPYRLVLSSDNMGKTNSLKISVAGDAALGSLLTHDPANNAGQNLSETVTALNADFKVNGVAVSKTSNTVTDVIEGVTLNLLKAPTTTPVNVSVARDTSSINTSVAAFVKGFNELRKTLQSISTYDPATKQAAVLQGDSAVRTVQSQIRAALSTSVNTGGSLTTLSQIGISFQKDGSLALDTTKLNSAISNNPGDIASLFASIGKATDSLVAYSSAATSTKPGNYAVSISTLATQGSSAGNVDLNAGPTTIAASTTMSVTLDGISASVALSEGTYTAAQMAAMIQSAINGTSAFSSAGSSVAATIDAVSGFMTITSNRYGSASNVSLSSGAGTPVSDFMGVAPPAPVAGVDVAGTIGGLAATGSGQFLTAAAGDATGLKVQISGGAIGARGTVNYSQGYAHTLNQLTTSMLASDGLLASRTKGVNNSIKDIGKQRDALNLRLNQLEANYRKQFSALDTMLSSMNATSIYLTQQLASLPQPY